LRDFGVGTELALIPADLDQRGVEPMMKSVGKALLVMCLLVLPGTALADGARHGSAQESKPAKQEQKNEWRRWEHKRGLPASPVPELDPGAAAQALAMLVAATALLIERRRAARG
jgi:hypothetical protein